MRLVVILVMTSCVFFFTGCGTSGVNLAAINAAMQASVRHRAALKAQEKMNVQPVLSVKNSAEPCPVTRPTEPLFVPPAPYPSMAPYGDFWYGSDTLWTMLRPDGKWFALPSDGSSLSNKVFWWYPGFDGTKNSSPAFKITGKQLDGDGTFATNRATNAYHEDFGGWTILTGVEIPSTGCWAITGEYEGESLTFVVDVGN